MTKSSPAVLVLGIAPSLIWPVARCLTRAGATPIVLGWHAHAPMSLTGDCHSYLRWSPIRKTDGRIDPDALEQVQQICQTRDVSLVMAADYDAALLLAACPLANGIPQSALPSASTIATFNNKWTFTSLLKQLDLPCPASEYIGTTQALRDTQLPFPIITKPLDKWASVGLQRHDTAAQLRATLNTGNLAAQPPLIAQAYIPGWDAGASFLASEGGLAAYSIFRHERKGERVFYEDARVRTYLESFITATHYSGVGHIDMRYDPSADSYSLLELNPRFWASLLYAANAGLNYPDLLARLKDWDRLTVRQANAATIRLSPYERAMTLSHRWFGSGYEKLTRSIL